MSITLADIDVSTSTSSSSSAHENKGRRVISRLNSNTIKVLQSLNPGKATNGCFVCCSAPDCCSVCSLCPCCSESEYIVVRKEASKYILIRENSLEWNEPRIVMKSGTCCGVDPCTYDIQDNVRILYFDDPIFDRISDQTRSCNECATCLLGGNGERLLLDSPVCCGVCVRATFPFVITCSCCSSYCCPCMLQHNIYLEDAQKGLYEIKKARRECLNHDFYKDLDINK